MKDDLFPIGRVARTHGVRGKIKIDYFGEDPSQFGLYREVFIRDRNGTPQAYEVLEVQSQPNHLILRLKKIETIEEAKRLIGREVLIAKKSLPKLPEGEYYWIEILGMEVETEQGKRLGRIEEILPTGANDVYVIRGGQKEIFLPAIESVIRSVDLEKRVMKVARTEGLWEREDEV